MKKSLINKLVCPECKSPLRLECTKLDGIDVIQGLLMCGKCGSNYPIINSIPRMTSSHRKDEIIKKTMKGFGYEWNFFKYIDKEFEKQFLTYYIKPFTPAFFKDKLGLDAGCGSGRFLFYSLKYGSEMVGVDFSTSVASAYLNTKDFDNVNIIQADLHALPLKEGIFDFIYSIGVLHHLPEPQRAFLNLVRLLKKNGVILIWVYFPISRIGASKYLFVIYAQIIKNVRKVTIKMPYRLLIGLCNFIAFFENLVFHYPFRILHRINILRKLSASVPFSYNHFIKFRTLVGIWFDRLFVPITQKFTSSQIREWFLSANLKKYELSQPWRGRAFGIK